MFVVIFNTIMIIIKIRNTIWIISDGGCNYDLDCDFGFNN